MTDKTRLLIPVGLIVVLAVPFVMRPREEALPADAWTLVIISPHGEAIRHEFEIGFSRWHTERFGRPVRIEWRSIGGTREIVRYIDAQMLAGFRQYWTNVLHKPWTEGIARAAQDYHLKQADADPDEWEARTVYLDDDQTPLDCGIDIFFGGGPYDHKRQARIGNSARIGLLDDGHDQLDTIPQRFRGEDYYPPRLVHGRPNRTFDRWYGTTLSSFGICYNIDRLRDLGIKKPPAQWSDLTDPAYFRQLGVADPTKSSSITKCFEMIIQQQIWLAVRRRGIDMAGDQPVPAGREQDVEDAKTQGWRRGLEIIQCIGANARYFTDSSNKVPIDVGQGDAAAGVCVGFYGRFQSEFTIDPDTGASRMAFVNPYDEADGVGGSSINADPVTLLRMRDDNASRPYRRTLAQRFVQFCVGTPSQKLWAFRAGTPGGPVRYTQRRIAIRRDFYTEENRRYMADPDLNPYTSNRFLSYREEWTGPLFNPLRALIKAMAIDNADELRAAWKAIIDAGGPEAVPDAYRTMTRLPAFEVDVDGRTVNVGLSYGAEMKAFADLFRAGPVTRLALTQRLTGAFRTQYLEARRLAEGG